MRAEGSRLTNSFDDLIGVAYQEDGENKVITYAATTDPGSYWAKHLMNSDGVAVVAEGQYRSLWMLGRHQGRYQALVQRNRVAVYRDYNLDDRLDLDRETIQRGFFGINLHRSNPYKKSEYVDKWSAGCQVLASPTDFKKLMQLLKKSASKYGNQFTYTLFNQEDFQ